MRGRHRLLLAAAAAALLAGCEPAARGPAAPASTAPAARPTAGRLVVTRVRGPALEDSALRVRPDPEVAIYLPPGYDDEPRRRYPVLYLLHGIGGTHADWTGRGYGGVTLQAAMERLVAAGTVPPMIVVMPTAMTPYGGSFYVDSAVNGGWATYVARDLVAHVDGTYRTLARREHRGVAGHSMGGYGAITLASSRPEVFGAAWAMSPCCLAWVAELGPDNPQWRRLIKLQHPRELRLALVDGDFYVPGFAAMAAAWSPAPGRPPLEVHLPFALGPDGERLVPSEPGHSMWQRAMPIARIEERAAALGGLRGLVIDTGEQDDFPHIPLGARLYSEALTAAGVRHRFETYPGDHLSRIGERLEREVLPYFGRLLATSPGGPAGPPG